MKKRIEKYFPAAMKAIQEVLQNNDPLKLIPREFQGYISAFGASVMQMGLLPTLAVHADKGSGAQEDKRLLLKVLALTLINTDNVLLENAKNEMKDHKEDLFIVTVKGNDELRRELTEHLLDATVAVKLCIRTFKLKNP